MNRQARRRTKSAKYRIKRPQDTVGVVFSQQSGDLAVAAARADQAGDKAKAQELYRRAIEVGPPNKLVLNNLGDLLCSEERYGEALDALAQALDLDPLYANALANAGLAMYGLSQFVEAEAAFRKAIALGDHPKAHMNLGLLLLTQGRFKEGFPEYNYRFSALGFALRGGDLPKWDGKEPTDKRLYIWSEQGLGDEILHFGGAGHLSEFASNVVWECDPRLVRLFKRSKLENIRFVPRADAIPEGAELQFPTGCVSQLYAPWEPRTAYLKADPARIAHFKALMPNDKRIVGLSWRSVNNGLAEKKSLPLEDFSAFLDNPDYHCISLQYGEREERPGLHHIEGLDITNDIDGLAALICACDVVVTISNTTAHLAGALGVPTIVRVSTGGGKLWYWGTGDRTDWYESVRIDRFSPHP